MHHCDFRFVRKQFFEEKIERKKSLKTKDFRVYFCVKEKNCYEFALHQDLPSQSLAQELPKKELRKKKSFKSRSEIN